MNRHDAVQFLHDRHPQVIDAPEDAETDLGMLHLDINWFQFHVCELMDRRRERALRKCFDTIHQLLVQGDREVRGAVCHDFFIPHLVFQPALGWARKRMPPFLAELCSKVEQEVHGESVATGSDDNTNA